MLTLPIAINEPIDTRENMLHRDLLIFASGFMTLAVMLWLAIYWYMGLYFSTTVPLSYQVISLISLLHYFKTRNIKVFRFVQLSLFLYFPFIMQWSIGSAITASGVTLWALLAPIGALVILGWRGSVPWFFAYLVMTVLSGYFDYYLGSGSNNGISIKTISVFFALNFAAMSAIIYFLVRYFVEEMDKIKAQLDQQNFLLAEEQKKSELLLLNVLPSNVVQRLKNENGLIADGFSDVTVMFADLVNFTQLTEALPPEQMVALLNRIFSGFDKLCEKYGVEKIKTIGDAYMAVGGLNRQKPDYTRDIVDMALEMRDFISSQPDLIKYNLSIHTGISTGPAVAGVIGTKRFSYDLWGDTVNIASRLTDEAMPNVIQVDKMTYGRIREYYIFESPANIQVKRKGDMIAYHLVSRRDENATPGR